MRFSITSASVVVLAAVGLAAAVCNLPTLTDCIRRAKDDNGGHEVGTCGEVANEHPYSPTDFRTVNCVHDLVLFYGKIGTVPAQCNGCVTLGV